MNLKELKQLAKKLDKKIKTEGWTISTHTWVLALVHNIIKLKETKENKED